jgi:hypothetical protein
MRLRILRRPRARSRGGCEGWAFSLFGEENEGMGGGLRLLMGGYGCRCEARSAKAGMKVE